MSKTNSPSAPATSAEPTAALPEAATPPPAPGRPRRDPAVGDVVHLVKAAGEEEGATIHRQATVHAVRPDNRVDLEAKTGRGGVGIVTGIRHDEEGKRVGTWHWPED